MPAAPPIMPATPRDYKHFDPECFERAAKAVREINKTPHAARAFDLAEKAQLTKQLQATRDEAKIKLQLKKEEARLVALAAEEERRNLAIKLQNEKSAAEFRIRLELEKERQSQQQKAASLNARLKAEKEALQDRERFRQESEKRLLSMSLAARREEKKMETALETAKIRETYTSMAKKERLNRDIALEMLREKAKLKSDLTLKIFADTMETGRKVAHRFFFDRGLRRKMASTFFLTTFALLSMRTGCRVAGEAIALRLGTPRLIRETSLGFRPLRRRRAKELPLKLTLQTDALVRDILAATRLSKKGLTSPRSYLFKGPPGTGKTTLARYLAEESGLDYAICSGGDFLAVGKSGLRELRRIFRWSERSRRGLLLFVDEAEAFLRKGRRQVDGLSEDTRALLALWLEATGRTNSKLSVVLATNIPEMLDEAVLDRIDESLCLHLPDLERRREILEMKLRELLIRQRRNVFLSWIGGRKTVVDLADLDVERLAMSHAELTEGQSGRQLEKLAASLVTKHMLQKMATTTTGATQPIKATEVGAALAS